MYVCGADPASSDLQDGMQNSISCAGVDATLQLPPPNHFTLQACRAKGLGGTLKVNLCDLQREQDSECYYRIAPKIHLS